jgi:hypothetical protein
MILTRKKLLGNIHALSYVSYLSRDRNFKMKSYSFNVLYMPFVPCE